MTTRRLSTIALLVLTLAGGSVLAGCPENKPGGTSTTTSATPAAVKSATPAASSQGNGW